MIFTIDIDVPKVAGDIRAIASEKVNAVLNHLSDEQVIKLALMQDRWLAMFPTELVVSFPRNPAELKIPNILERQECEFCGAEYLDEGQQCEACGKRETHLKHFQGLWRCSTCYETVADVKIIPRSWTMGSDGRWHKDEE